jgi:hypothetical protein
MNKYLKLSLLTLIVSSPFAFSAEQENEWTPSESPMEAIYAGKVILDITHLTTSGDGKTIYALAVIRANREGMMGKFFFRSLNGGLTWSVLNKKTK